MRRRNDNVTFTGMHDGSRHHADYGRRFALGIALNLGFVAVELVYGLVARSLALVADAGHNLSDVAGLVLAWGAVWLATRAPTSRRTYGFRKATVIASFASAILLLVALGVITTEAIGRLRRPAPADGGVMIAVAAVGVVVNTATALLFLAGRKTDLNIRGAFLHMAGDAGVSVGVVAGGFAVGRTGWLWIDPALSLVIVLVILIGTWSLLRESAHLMLDGVPRGVDPAVVQAWLAARPGVAGVHDLHIWPLSTTETALTVHLVMPAGHPGDKFLADVAEALHAQHGIAHTTIQVELVDSDHGCSLGG